MSNFAKKLFLLTKNTMKLKDISLYLLTLASLVAIMWSCATASSPGGGPQDSLPPICIDADPMPYSVNFKGKRAVLTFNEYVKLKDQSKLFFLAPTYEKRPLLTIKGKSIVVDFQMPLDSNTTHTLDFGASIVDNNEGNQMDNFVLPFSTGSYVDSLIMAGQTLNAYTRDTIIGGFVQFFDPSSDSLKLDSVMLKARAEVISRTDSSGYFVASTLQEKPYRIYAYQDNNGNQRYEPGTDLIALTEGNKNPVDQEGFSMIYDSLERRWQMTSVPLTLELFKEDPPRKQTLGETKRPQRQQLYITFNAPQATIDTLEFEGIDSSWIQREWDQNRDSLTVWITPPTIEDIEKLQDTIKARLAYQKQDSVWKYYTHSQDIQFTHKIEITAEEKKVLELKRKQELKEAKEKEKKASKKNKKKKKKVEKVKPLSKCKIKRLKRKGLWPPKDSLQLDSLKLDSLGGNTPKIDSLASDSIPPKNPFKVNVAASTKFMPLNDIIFKFEYPLREILIDSIKLSVITPKMVKGRAVQDDKGTAAPQEFEMVKDSLNSKVWILKAPWKVDSKYEILIPANTFTNIALQRNDTLQSSFTVESPSKYGSVEMNFKQDSLYEGNYIIQFIKLGNKSDVADRELIIDNKATKLTVKYLPEETFRIRIIRDANSNKRWDTGDIRTRKEPEKVRVYENQGVNTILSKPNWEVVVDLDLPELFN